MGKLTRQDFREICADFNVLIPLHVIDGIYIKVQETLEEGEFEKNATPKVIAAYIKKYREVYKNYPIITPADTGRLKSLLKSIGSDEGIALIETYLDMKDGYFKERHHDLFAFINNINKVQGYRTTGISNTRTRAQADERVETNQQTLKQYLARRNAPDER